MASVCRRRDEAQRELDLRKSVRSDLLKFTRLTHHSYVVGDHHRDICDALAAVVRGEIDRLMLFAPPRSGKSEIVSVRFPAWYLGITSHKQILTVSYEQGLATGFGRKVRNIVASRPYRRFFDRVTLTKDNHAAHRWGTNRGGSYEAIGINGAASGKGADILVIDDPFKGRKEADSETIRDAVWERYDSDLQSRMMPGGAIVVMHTRWHEDDLAGRLMQQAIDTGEKWTILKFPAIIDEYTPRERSLHPERFSTPEMQRRRKMSLPRTWRSIYQQDPFTESGEFFQVAWFKRYELGKHPVVAIYITSDYAVTDGDGDFTEHGVWGFAPNGDLYALDWWYGQTESDIWLESLFKLVRRWKPRACFGEGGVIAKAVNPMLVRAQREESLYFVQEYVTSSADKPTRARGFQARSHAGTVWVPRTDWGDRLIAQLVKFPGGKFDDAVDVCSLMGNVLDVAHPAVERLPEKPKPRDIWKQGSRSERQTNWKVV